MGLYVSGDGSNRRGADQRSEGSHAPAARSASKGTFPFKAELDLAELDERGRPGPMWAGRATELSRSQLMFRSRKMCYDGRELMIAVHLVDDRPVALYGVVHRSEYDGDGLYATVVDLATLPETDAIHAWVAALAPRT